MMNVEKLETLLYTGVEREFKSNVKMRKKKETHFESPLFCSLWSMTTSIPKALPAYIKH